MQFDVNGWGTIRPDKENKTWGDIAFRSIKDGGHGYADYLGINSFTDDGLDEIAAYNKYSQEWEVEKSQFTKETHMMQKRFVNFKLYAKYRNRRRYHLDPIEGGHRRIGNIQASFCGKFDFNRGSLKDTASMSVHHFTEAGLTLKDAGIDPERISDQILAAYLSVVDNAKMGEGFFGKTDSVKVIYMTSWQTPVPELLSACRVASDMHSRTKRQSATKDPFVELAHHASKYMMSMQDVNFKHDPDLGHIFYGGQNKFPAKKVKKDLSEDLHWDGDREELSNKIPLTDNLYGEAYEAYCQDPFCSSKEKRVMDEFESFGIKKTPTGRYDTDKSVKLRPPFRVSWEAMAVHAALGRQQRATVEMINKWMLLPKFMHILTAHTTHRSLVETSRNEELLRLILYLVRHHVHSFSSANLGAHQCLTIVYKFPMAPACLPTSEYVMLHASLYLTEIINAYLIDETLSDPLETTENKKAYLRGNAKFVAALLSTMQHMAGYCGLENMIVTLGKFLLSFLFFTSCKFFSNYIYNL